MTTRLITAPTSEPITLAEAKLHLKVDVTDDDALITLLISAARQQAEQLTGRSLMPQTWEKVLDAFPCGDIQLLWPTITGITSITYIDAVTQLPVVLASNQYTLDSDSEPGWAVPAFGVTWPTTLDTANALRVRYTAGYAAAANVPESIKQWMKLAIGTWYNQREAVVIGARIVVLPLPNDFYSGLLDRYTIWIV